MNIYEAIQAAPDTPVLVDPYYMMVEMESKVRVTKPVDFRLNDTNVPLKSSDISFIYSTATEDKTSYRYKYYTNYYFPIGHQLSMPDNMMVTLVDYKRVNKLANNKFNVIITAVPVAEDIQIYEDIRDDSIEKQVFMHMNNILRSNDALVKLLPRYNYDWYKYTGTLTNMELINAYNKLGEIKAYEDTEISVEAADAASLLRNSYMTLPIYTINRLYRYTVDLSSDNYLIDYHGVTGRYRLKPIVNWMISKAMVEDENLFYDSLFAVNSNEDYRKIEIAFSAPTATITFSEMPNHHPYTYTLSFEPVASDSTYLQYTLNSISLIKTNIVDNTTEEFNYTATNYFDVLLEAIKILWEDTGDDYDTLYRNLTRIDIESKYIVQDITDNSVE